MTDLSERLAKVPEIEKRHDAALECYTFEPLLIEFEQAFKDRAFLLRLVADLKAALDEYGAALVAARASALEEAAVACRTAKLPDGYQWSASNQSKFKFGAERAAEAVCALKEPT